MNGDLAPTVISPESDQPPDPQSKSPKFSGTKAVLIGWSFMVVGVVTMVQSTSNECHKAVANQGIGEAIALIGCAVAGIAFLRGGRSMEPRGCSVVVGLLHLPAMIPVLIIGNYVGACFSF